MAGAGHLGRWGSPGTGLLLLIVSAAVMIVGGRWLARHGVLSLPAMRANGTNLLAWHGDSAPALWLVAHLDSKSQPVSIAARAAGVVASVAAWLAMGALLVAGRSGFTVAPAAWVLVTLGGVAAALPLIASTVGDRSDGAVDNASGVVAVLAAAALLPADVRSRVGIALTSGEEIGLAGARAWAAGTRPATAINCDSIDDRGEWVIMYAGREPHALVESLRLAGSVGVPGAWPAGTGQARERIRARRLPPGILTDHLALSDAGWTTVTLSRGDTSTLRRIHTPRDDLQALRGDAVIPAARILATAVMRLCTYPTPAGMAARPTPGVMSDS